MKKNGLHFYRIIFVCFIMLFPLSACKNPTADPTPKPIDPLVITSEYQLIRSDTAASDVTGICLEVTKALEAKGTVIPIGTDWVNRKGVADYPEKATEILVGKTNRAISQEVLAELPDNGYTVRVVDQSVIAIGKDDFCTVQAVKYLVSLLSEDGIPKDLCYNATCPLLYTYQIDAGVKEKYDACATAFCLQGLINRESGTKVYITSKQTKLPSETLQLMQDDERWLSGTNCRSIGKWEDLLAFAKPYIRTVVLWDPDVPATLNVATTIVGVEDGILLTEAQYAQYKSLLSADLPVISLVGKFDGSQTGSVKNDAYRWAIEEYLAKGRCSLAYICNYADSFEVRDSGNVGYLTPRDWAVYNRAFVYDLSMWSDEVPKDDLKQKAGLDRSTLLSIFRTVEGLRGSEQLTEIDGFIISYKYAENGNNDTFTSKYDGTQCEWEYANLFSGYGFYWNPANDNAYNMTVHKDAYTGQTLKQNRPQNAVSLQDDEDHVYILIVMGDYDSSSSLYLRMTQYWKDEGRGDLPLAWSYNPNLLQKYPDLLTYFYETATPNDYFVSNAGAAGWFTPSKVPAKYWNAYVAFNKQYFSATDISCAPDFWDFDAFNKETEAYIGQFATTGMGALVSNILRRGTGIAMTQHLTADYIPVDPLYNNYVRDDAALCATKLKTGVEARARNGHATFMAFRAVWSTPTYLASCIDELKTLMPGKTITVLDPYTYYDYLAASLAD